MVGNQHKRKIKNSQTAVFFVAKIIVFYFIKIFPTSTNGIIDKLVAKIINHCKAERVVKLKMLAKKGMK